MLQFENGNRLYSYAFYALAAGVFVSSLVAQNGYLATLSAVLLFASAAYFSSGHIVNNMLLKRGVVVEVCNGYRLSEGLASAVKQIGSEYFAVSCVLLKNAPTERNGEQITSLVYNANFPFEFSIGLKSVDQGRLLDSLEERRRMKEIEIARSDPKKYDKVNGLRRELALMESEIRSIRGGRLLATSTKLKTFAKSTSEFEASREAARNAEQIANSFASALGFEHEILKGERLLEELEIEREVA